jgi:hypothetical protein
MRVRAEGPWREDLGAEGVGGSAGCGMPGEWTSLAALAQPNVGSHSGYRLGSIHVVQHLFLAQISAQYCGQCSKPHVAEARAWVGIGSDGPGCAVEARRGPGRGPG